RQTRDKQSDTDHSLSERLDVHRAEVFDDSNKQFQCHTEQDQACSSRYTTLVDLCQLCEQRQSAQERPDTDQTLGQFIPIKPGKVLDRRRHDLESDREQNQARGRLHHPRLVAQLELLKYRQRAKHQSEHYTDSDKRLDEVIDVNLRQNVHRRGKNAQSDGDLENNVRLCLLLEALEGSSELVQGSRGAFGQFGHAVLELLERPVGHNEESGVHKGQNLLEGESFDVSLDLSDHRADKRANFLENRDRLVLQADNGVQNTLPDAASSACAGRSSRSALEDASEVDLRKLETGKGVAKLVKRLNNPVKSVRKRFERLNT